jgi:hypothetical protein
MAIDNEFIIRGRYKREAWNQRSSLIRPIKQNVHNRWRFPLQSRQTLLITNTLRLWYMARGQHNLTLFDSAIIPTTLPQITILRSVFMISIWMFYFSRTQEQFFLTVGQNNFDNKIAFPNAFCKKWSLWHLWPLKCISNRAFNAIDAHHHLLGGPFFCISLFRKP